MCTDQVRAARYWHALRPLRPRLFFLSCHNSIIKWRYVNYISVNFNNGTPFAEILELQAHRLTPHCNLFEGILCPACLKLQQVRSKIRECKEFLETLYIQEAHIKSSVNASHDHITCRLPQELVPKIFIECAPYSVEIGRFFHLTSSYSPRYQFPLGSVSKHGETSSGRLLSSGRPFAFTFRPMHYHRWNCCA